MAEESNTELDEAYWGFPPLPSGLKTIGSLDETQLKTVQVAISGPHGFTRSVKHCEELADKLGIQPARVFELLTALEYLYDHARSWGAPDGIRGFLKITGLESFLGNDPTATFSRITTLLQPNPELEHQKKVRWLQTGILETVTGFSSFVDLRPNFTTDRLEIIEFIATVILRITTDSANEGHVLQLTEQSIVKMKETLEDIEKKLATLRQDEGVKSRVYRTIIGKETR